MKFPFKIEFIDSCELIGQKIVTSHASNETSKLWRPFRQQLLEKSISPDIFYSIQNYGESRAKENFDATTEFEKWAAIAKSQHQLIDDFEEFCIEAGLYLTFSYSRTMGDLSVIIEEIIQVGLLNLGYRLDSRPHFETFDLDYDPFSPESVEKIHIPVINY